MDLIVSESDYFENKKEWMRAFEVLKHAVKEHLNESKYLCKLALLCWYHSVEPDGDLESLNEKLLDDTLMACFIEGKEKFNDNGIKIHGNHDEGATHGIYVLAENTHDFSHERFKLFRYLVHAF